MPFSGTGGSFAQAETVDHYWVPSLEDLNVSDPGVGNVGMDSVGSMPRGAGARATCDSLYVQASINLCNLVEELSATYLVVAPTCDILPVFILSTSAKGQVARSEILSQLSRRLDVRKTGLLGTSLTSSCSVKSLENDIHDTLRSQDIASANRCCARWR